MRSRRSPLALVVVLWGASIGLLVFVAATVLSSRLPTSPATAPRPPAGQAVQLGPRGPAFGPRPASSDAQSQAITLAAAVPVLSGGQASGGGSSEGSGSGSSPPVASCASSGYQIYTPDAMGEVSGKSCRSVNGRRLRKGGTGGHGMRGHPPRDLRGLGRLIGRLRLSGFPPGRILSKLVGRDHGPAQPPQDRAPLDGSQGGAHGERGQGPPRD